MHGENKFIQHKEIWEGAHAIINNECKELNTSDHPVRHEGWNAVIRSLLSPLDFFLKRHTRFTVSGTPLLAGFIFKIIVWGIRIAQLK